MRIDLTGEVALVTGAAGAIGAATAASLARAGAAVAVADIGEVGAAEVADRLTAEGLRAMPVALDIADEAGWDVATSAVEEAFGPVTVLHNNAAHKSPEVMKSDGNVLEVPLDVWDAVLAVNLRGTLLGCRRVLPGMIERGKGSIIITSSVTADFGGSGRVAYSVSKSGLHALVRHVATAFGKQGIRCNAVSPGIVLTPTNAQIISAAQRAVHEESHLTPRLGRPEDVASLVTFLASDQAEFITGHAIPIDGGLTAHLPAF